MDTTTPTGWEGILAEDEQILWQGRPDDQVEWSGLLSFESFFGLFFGGFAAFWIAGAVAATGLSRGGGGIDAMVYVFPLFGLPFLAVGLYMVFGRLLWDAYVRRYTWYTLTNRAAYIARDIRGKRSLKSWSYEDMQTPALHDNTPGSVIFAEELRTSKRRSRSRNALSGPTRTSTQRIPIGFKRIDNARQVYRLIMDHRDRLARDDAKT